MTDSILQIAECLDSLRVEIEALSARIAHGALDGDHVRSKLGDYSMVLYGVRERLLMLAAPNQELPAADETI